MCDIFDDLNSYLDKTDDYGMQDEEDSAGFNELDVEPVGPEESVDDNKKRRKRASGVNVSKVQNSPSKKRNQSSNESTNQLSDQSSISSANETGDHVIVLEEDGVNHLVQETREFYQLYFIDTPQSSNPHKNFYKSLKKRYDSIMVRFEKSQQRRSSRRGGKPAWVDELKQIHDTLHDMCWDCGLLVPVQRTVDAPRRRAAPQVETINLVDSPALLLPGTINLDSDDEDDQLGRLSSNQSENLSFESENYEVSLKLKWQGKIERIPHRKHQKFADLIERLAVRSGNVDPARVVLDINGRVIRGDDTPDTIQYRISQFITGRVVDSTVCGGLRSVSANADKPTSSSLLSSSHTSAVAAATAATANTIELKVQTDRNPKKPLVVRIDRHARMRIAVIKCAEELHCKPEQIRLSFDGEPVSLEATPVELELEGGEMLDLRFR